MLVNFESSSSVSLCLQRLICVPLSGSFIEPLLIGFKGSLKFFDLQRLYFSEFLHRYDDMIGSGSPENDALIGEVAEEAQNCAGDMGVYGEDLAYSRKGVSLEDRPSIADEDLESVPLPFPSISMSSRERRWSDTTPYASKKVLYNFWLWISI